MISTLSKGSQAGAYTFTAERIFDAWGLVRSSNATGDPKGRYCANLGHKQDDESGLIYMRARYYEPSTGRFLSEDPSRNGANWFSYAGSNPVSNCDATGKDILALIIALLNSATAIFNGASGSSAMAKEFAIDDLEVIVNSLIREGRLANMMGWTVSESGEAAILASSYTGPGSAYGLEIGGGAESAGLMGMLQSDIAQLFVDQVDDYIEMLGGAP